MPHVNPDMFIATKVVLTIYICAQYRLDLKAAYLGLGSCWALTGRLDEATQAFTSAIKLDPKVALHIMFSCVCFFNSLHVIYLKNYPAQCADAWKRRGQTNAAADRVDEGLSDLKQAQRLGEHRRLAY